MTEQVESAVLATLLRKQYPGHFGGEKQVAIEQLDLLLRPGEALMLVGPNGAGKSTALRLMAGIERPDSGRLTILGTSPGAMDNRRRVGYLPDSSEMFPFLDVVETLSFFTAAANLKKAEAKRRIDEMVDLFEMGEWKKKRTKTFSLGMRRRLGLACTLIGAPDLLLLDEPTSGLDPAAARLFLNVCKAQKEKGVALVISSHHLGQVEGLCDQIIAMKKGRVVFSGSTEVLSKEIGRFDLELSGFDLQHEADLEKFLASIGAKATGKHVSERGLEDFLLGDD